MELSKRDAEVSALEARVSLQSDYIQQLEACVGRVRLRALPLPGRACALGTDTVLRKIWRSGWQTVLKNTCKGCSGS